jgi:tRNA pseudouridine38-40 synthase
MKKFLLTVEYSGTNFNGWQIQPKGRTVQGEIESALSTLLNEKITIYGSGRTDSGVHALAQTAHFESSSDRLKNFYTKKLLNRTKLVQAINAHLPKDIKILSVRQVNSTFHARYDVKEKIYLYKLQIGTSSPLTKDLVANYARNLDIESMRKGAIYLIGTHDFTSFSSAKTEINGFVRTINYIKIRKKGNEFTFEISANGYLYNMVRIIVGTLIDVGSNKLAPQEIKTILEYKDRTKASKTAPACGLYLKKVKY